MVWTFLGPGSGRTLSEWESFNTIRYYLLLSSVISKVKGMELVKELTMIQLKELLSYIHVSSFTHFDNDYQTIC